MKHLKQYKQFIKEALENEELQNKISDKFKDIKIDFLEILAKSINSEDVEQVKSFLSDYTKENSTTNIEGLVNDADINQFYIKYGNDIDEILENDGKLKESPIDIESFGLYDYVIKQTKKALKELTKMILSDLESDTQNESLMFWKNKKNKEVGKLVLVDNKVRSSIFVYQILEDKDLEWKSVLIGDIKRNKFSPWLGQKVLVDGKLISKRFIFENIKKSDTYKPSKDKLEIISKEIVGDVKSKIEKATGKEINLSE